MYLCIIAYSPSLHILKCLCLNFYLFRFDVIHIKTTDIRGSALFECFLFFLQNLTNAAIYKCPWCPDFCIRICMRVISHSVTQGRGHFSFTFWKQRHQQHFFNRTDCFVNSKADGFYRDDVWKGCMGFQSIPINDHCTMPRIHKWNGVLKNDIYSLYHVNGVFFFLMLLQQWIFWRSYFLGN